MDNRSLNSSFNSTMTTLGNGQSPVEEKQRKSSLNMLLPKATHPSSPSLESLSYQSSLHSPLPSPGDGHLEDPNLLKVSDTPIALKSSDSSKMSVVESPQTKLEKRESYKAQRKNYRREKKRVAKELLSTLRDPSIIVLADWLKVRGMLKSWTKLWCVLKPGLLLLYKSPKTHKSSHWVGTVLLNTCEVIERPSKKDGFCFKVFHPLEQSIWASRGPSGETIGAVVQPLPNAYLIFRAPSEPAGKCWMDALELALRCSSLLMRSMVNKSNDGNNANLTAHTPPPSDLPITPDFIENRPHVQWNESDYESHFADQDLEDDAHTDENREADHDGIHSLKSTDSDSDGHEKMERGDFDANTHPVETPYLENGDEEFGLVGDAGQTEEVAEENKSLIWSLVRQVRPGMDLSKVVLPTFILEPRSFLDKLSDYYYHADILSTAVLEDDAFTRMKLVVQWYLSGFYKKPRGLKKPYNPILGETFRCYWKHPQTNSRTFYIAEQVSHHPPVSAFYVTNRKDGFCIRGSILAKSKFYGNSLSAILDGKGRLTFLTRGEDYIITMPYAHCKGILMGTLTMELGGKIQIDCEKTGYKTEIEFKLKPFLGGSEQSNMISGKIKLGKETLTLLEGHWDQDIYAVDKKTGEKQLLWNPTPEIRSRRLKRFTVPVDCQGEAESERLWVHVSAAIAQGNQIAATEEKTILEEAQRQAVKERKAKCVEWMSHYFDLDMIHGEWVYRHADSRPWDPRNDVVQYECDYMIRTKTRHKTPIIRTSSIVSVDDQITDCVLTRTPRRAKPTALNRHVHNREDSESSTPEAEGVHVSDSSDSEVTQMKPSTESVNTNSSSLKDLLLPTENLLRKQGERLESIQQHVVLLIKEQRQLHQTLCKNHWIFIAALVVIQAVTLWILK